MKFLKYKKIYYSFSAGLILLSLVSLVLWGLKPGIEFTGGSIMEVEYDIRPEISDIRLELSALNLGDVFIQTAGEKGIIIRTKDISPEVHQEIMDKIGNPEEKYFESIGPAIGQELTRKSFIAIVLASLAVILYIAITFSGASGPIKSWQYGVIASLVAFFHDVLIILGLFSFLGNYFGAQFTIPIIVALLTTLGYSINDTVVIFDRIRENIVRSTRNSFDEIIEDSLNQTIARSLNTSFTTLLVLLAIFFLGGETLKFFVLALIVGVIAGTYSSIFLAAPLLSSWLNKN